jgi:hypothetical protein
MLLKFIFLSKYPPPQGAFRRCRLESRAAFYDSILHDIKGIKINQLQLIRQATLKEEIALYSGTFLACSMNRRVAFERPRTRIRLPTVFSK